MDRCYLFTKYLQESSCLCLKISQEGNLIAPPEQRLFAEISDLQKECLTFLVESAENASLLSVELPWLSEGKARQAIPYALEDKLAQPIEELHFAFDKLRYQNNHYLVTVINKQRLQFLIDIFKAQHIDFDLITLDWFGIPPATCCISESVLLINTDNFKGALSGELACNYIQNHPLAKPLRFIDSHLNDSAFKDLSLSNHNESPGTIKNNDSSFTWIAQNLTKNKALNLCQGSLRKKSTVTWVKQGYQLLAGLCLFWLLSFLLLNSLALHNTNKDIKQLDQDIAVIYHQFFPEAKQVISPKFRIMQLLKTSNNNTTSVFWFLLNQFAKTAKLQPVQVEQLHFQNKTLIISFITSDFSSLEIIENQLRKLSLQVKQTHAATQDKQVAATLELM